MRKRLMQPYLAQYLVVNLPQTAAVLGDSVRYLCHFYRIGEIQRLHTTKWKIGWSVSVPRS